MGICFVVLGTTRSGTSVTAGLMHRLGVVMGWELIPEGTATERYDWPDPCPMNPLGFYQDAPLENVQDALWGDDYPTVGQRPHDHKLIKEFKSLIKMRCKRRHSKWGFKTSRAAWMMPEIVEACSDDLKIVVTKRDPDVSAHSLHHWFHHQFTKAQCKRFINDAKTQIDNVLGEYNNIPRVIISFDRLIDDRIAELTKLAVFLGNPLTQEAIDFVSTELRRIV